jgi:translation elongation factor EF-Tu-like GTPase
LELQLALVFLDQVVEEDGLLVVVLVFTTQVKPLYLAAEGLAVHMLVVVILDLLLVSTKMEDRIVVEVEDLLMIQQYQEQVVPVSSSSPTQHKYSKNLQ